MPAKSFFVNVRELAIIPLFFVIPVCAEPQPDTQPAKPPATFKTHCTGNICEVIKNYRDWQPRLILTPERFQTRQRVNPWSKIDNSIHDSPMKRAQPAQS